MTAPQLCVLHRGQSAAAQQQLAHSNVPSNSSQFGISNVLYLLLP
jgi:hypothetical protein